MTVPGIHRVQVAVDCECGTTVEACDDEELLAYVTQVVMQSEREPASREAIELNFLELERGLVEHQRQGPSRSACPDATKAKQGPALAVAPLVDVGRFGDLRHLGADAGRLEDAGHLVVEMDRPRLRVRLRLPPAAEWSSPIAARSIVSLP